MGEDPTENSPAWASRERIGIKQGNPHLVQSTMRTNLRVLIALALVSAAVAGGCSDTLGNRPTGATEDVAVLPEGAVEELFAELELVASSVSIPVDWEVEASNPDSVILNAAPGGIGYKASSDLSSSGTWMLITATPTALLEGADSAEDLFWLFTERHLAGRSEGLVQKPVAISTSGLDGYSYELSGGKGAKTGQELGGFFAILFGDKYTYQVIIQFYIPDRNEMKVLFQETLSGLTLRSDDDYS